MRLPHTRQQPSDTSAKPPRDLRAWFTRHAAHPAQKALAPLLGAAAVIDLDDHEAVTQLRQHAHDTTVRLVAADQLPPQLIVATDDPGVVVVRTLAVAWRRVTPPQPSEQQGPRDRKSLFNTPEPVEIIYQHAATEGRSSTPVTDPAGHQRPGR